MSECGEQDFSKVSVSESIVPMSTCQGVGGGHGTFGDKCVRVQSVRFHCISVLEFRVSEFNVSRCQSTVCQSLLYMI